MMIGQKRFERRHCFEASDNAQRPQCPTPILAGISPSHNRFKQSKETVLISDIFLVSDEAFGLMILHNEHHVWVNNRDGKKDKTMRCERKRYCDANSGSRDGWMLEGVEAFDGVKLRDRFQRENNRNYDVTSGTSTASAGGGLATRKQKFFIDPVLLGKKIQTPIIEPIELHKGVPIDNGGPALAPDQYPAGHLCGQFNSRPSSGHTGATKYDLWYLKHAAWHGVWFMEREDWLQSNHVGFVPEVCNSDDLLAFKDACWGPQDASKPQPNDTRTLSLLDEMHSLEGFITRTGGP
eukprot:jgi/Psemu1/494/gm1.494_g